MTTPPEPTVHAPDAGRVAATIEVDARGLNCPMPVIELAKAMRSLPPGATVHLLATDSTSKVDVPVWCRMQREQLLDAHEWRDEAGVTIYDYLVGRTDEQ